MSLLEFYTYMHIITQYSPLKNEINLMIHLQLISQTDGFTLYSRILVCKLLPLPSQLQQFKVNALCLTHMVCVYFTHPFASASANRWVCLRSLSDGAHHQLYQRTLLPVGQHYRGKTEEV